MRQADEPVLVQALIPQSSVERLNVGVLIGFARLDQEQPHTTGMRPSHHRLAEELLAVVGADRLWQTVLYGQPVQDARSAWPQMARSGTPATASCVASSTTVRHLMTRPSAVRSNTKSIDHT